jgi:hypothetical protein
MNESSHLSRRAIYLFLLEGLTCKTVSSGSDSSASDSACSGSSSSCSTSGEGDLGLRLEAGLALTAFLLPSLAAVDLGTLRPTTLLAFSVFSAAALLSLVEGAVLVRRDLGGEGASSASTSSLSFSSSSRTRLRELETRGFFSAAV